MIYFLMFAATRKDSSSHTRANLRKTICYCQARLKPRRVKIFVLFFRCFPERIELITLRHVWVEGGRSTSQTTKETNLINEKIFPEVSEKFMTFLIFLTGAGDVKTLSIFLKNRKTLKRQRLSTPRLSGYSRYLF